MNNIQKYFLAASNSLNCLKRWAYVLLNNSLPRTSTVLPELHQAKRMLKLQTEISSAPVFREWVNQLFPLLLRRNRSFFPSMRRRPPLATPVDPPITDFRKQKGTWRSHTRPPNISPPRPGCRKNTATSPQNMFTPTRSRKPTCKRHQAHDLLPDMMGAVIVLLLFICILFSISVTTLCFSMENEAGR